MVPRCGRLRRAGERPHRGHRLDLVSGCDRRVEPCRHPAALDHRRGDAQLPHAVSTRPRLADRVRLPHVLAADRRAQGEVLSGQERVLVPQLSRHRERHRHGLVGQPLDPGHVQRVEPRSAHRRGRSQQGHQSVLNSSNVSRHASQRRSALHAVDPNRASSTVSSEPQRGQTTVRRPSATGPDHPAGVMRGRRDPEPAQLLLAVVDIEWVVERRSAVVTGGSRPASAPEQRHVRGDRLIAGHPSRWG